jgi:SAM-dependent methyltransferase
MKAILPGQWEELGQDTGSTWYLDPVVAKQKGDLHLALIQRWSFGKKVQTFLKTDLFEEANGADELMSRLFPEAKCAVGMDVSWSTACTAAKRSLLASASFITTDARQLAMRGESVDFVVSTSTLDHFDTRREIGESLKELARVLRPGGRLIITLDNPQNLMYPLLRWISRRPGAPFPLGATFTLEELNREIARTGLCVEANDWLIHNPRLVSTVLVLGLRRLLRSGAEKPIEWLLKLFAQLGKLPTRRYSACFVAALASKPGPLSED